MSRAGTVYLVGAGPGDPELITVRGLGCLKQADVVVYDRLVHPDLLAMAPATAERVYAGKVPGGHACDQRWIEALLIERARAGLEVVRLKGGDPFVFGRGGEEVLACREAGIPCVVVPGITSAVAVPGAAGIPLTHRCVARSFAVLSAHRPAELDATDWRALTRLDTLVVMMGVEALPQVTARLLAAGLPPERPAAIVERGTWAEERTVTGTLATIADQAREAAIEPPAILVVGAVVGVLASAAARAVRPTVLPLPGVDSALTR